MSYAEAAFIPLKAYEALENERVRDGLNPDELYVAMFALGKNANRREAAKLPVEFQTVDEVSPNLHRVSLAIVTKHRQLDSVFEEEFFRDGYWVDVGEHMSIIDSRSGGRYRPTDSYVRTFDRHIDSDLGMEDISVGLTADDLELLAGRELVTA